MPFLGNNTYIPAEQEKPIFAINEPKQEETPVFITSETRIRDIL